MKPVFAEPSLERVRALLRSMVGHKVAVIGDVMLADYVWGEVERVSPEAPIPVVRLEREEILLGGAANAAKCLVALGAEVRLVASVGDDGDADLLLRECADIGISEEGLVRDASRHTTRKTRVVAQLQQLVRIDRESPHPLSQVAEASILRRVQDAVEWADAVVLSDYSKGVVTPAVCRAAIDTAGDRPSVVDPKNLPWDRFSGATVLKPNAREAASFSGTSLLDDASAAECAGQLVHQIGVEYALVTRGSDGMTLSDSESSLTFRARPLDLKDGTGCGDVVAATLVLALASGIDIPTAAWLANAAAGVEASKFGVAPVAGQEVLDFLDPGRTNVNAKLLSTGEVREFANACRTRGQKVVFTNGCFDILHAGHANYLERSAKLGDVLVVGINSDASVRKLKGPGRPIQHERDRAQIMASLAYVDAVVVFDEDTPIELIRAVQPNVITKGADYERKENVVGWDIVQASGGRVELIELVEGRSTTDLIEKARH